MADLRIAPIATPSPAAIPAVARPAIGGEAGEAGGSFGAMLTNAVADVNARQLEARDAAVELAAGRSTDTAQALVAIEKANVSFQFAMQVRNKLLEAYQEIMRMSV
ncbi:MAG TPA: flagellar hook-basal body complex protein FliE [Terriglobales bacterium]|nr:flagellar hook-basal body complex protein FliE [Terriglobales bacterium]